MAGSDIDIHGTVAPGFEGVRDQMAAHFAEGLETGAGVAATLDGDVVVDLWAGAADRSGERPFTNQTLVPVFSCSKAVSALVAAWVVDQGRLSYGDRVAELWPEFAQNGKDAVTVAHVMSHQAGLPGFADDWDGERWFDWEATVGRLASMAPMWPLGAGSGYHPITWGYLVGEIVRRAAGRTLGAILADEICAPLGLDFWIGLPAGEHHRAARPIKPPRAPDLGELNPETRAAFLTRWYTLAGDWTARLSFALPSAGGVGAALGMARLMEPFAREGRLGARALVSPGVVAEATQERVAGPDRVLPYTLSWGAGLIRNTPRHAYYGPGARSVGHTGFGGSCLLADPDRRLSLGYATARLSPALVEDVRARALIGAVYGAL